jgi:hypothetical protein
VTLRALLASVVLLLLSAVIFTSGAGRGAAPAAPVTVPRAPVVPSDPPPPTMPLRNIFEYGEEPTPVAQARPRFSPAPVPVAPPVEVAPPEAPVHPVRLVGFVRRGGGLQAALAIRGSVYVLAVGEEAEGYLLLAADEDGGVRIQDRDGAVLTLPPPS